MVLQHNIFLKHKILPTYNPRAVNMGCMERDVVYCSQNALFVLPRKMLKILYQLCTWSMSVRNAVYITPVYVDAIKILGAHILCLPFYSVPLFYITQSFTKKC